MTITNHRPALIRIQMQSAVPRNAIGYVADLGRETATPECIADRLAMLERHCPSLVAQYREAIAEN